MTITDLLSKLDGVSGPYDGGQYTAKCPAHDDNHASLCINVGDGDKILVHCQAGCDVKAVVAAMGLKMQDLFAEGSKPPAGGSKAPPKAPVTTYIYSDADNKPHYKVVRMPDKQFYQHRYDHTTKRWISGIKGIERLPYALPNVKKAIANGNTIFVVEGEKDVHTLLDHRFTATCNSGGAGKWLPDFGKYFEGADIILVPDNDKPGCIHMLDVGCSLQHAAKSIKYLQLPVPLKGDVSDWFLTGGTREVLMELAANAPDWRAGIEIEPWGEAKGLPGTTTAVLSTVYSQVYNAELFYEVHGANVHWCPNDKNWYYWDSQVWRYDDLGTVKRMMMDCIKSLYTRLPGMSRADAEQLMRHIKSSENVRAIEGAVDAVKLMDNVTTRESDFDAQAHLISTLNGTLNISTGELQQFSRDDKITIQIPVHFDPAARAARWERFITEIFPGDIDTQKYVQRLAGYLLLGNNDRHECYIFHGKPSTGKSKFAETIRKLLGEHSRPILKSQLIKNLHGGTDDRKGVADVWSRRLVPCSEFSSTDNLDEDLIKNLSGGDTISVCKKYGHPFIVKPRFKLLLYTNFMPRFKSTGYDMRKRLRIVPFNVSFYPVEDGRTPVRDNDIEEKFALEFSGILNWMLRGYQDLVKYGNPESLAVTAKTNECFEEQDAIGDFLNEYCIYDFGASIPLKELWGELQNHCERTKRKPPFRDSRGLKSNLQNRDGITFVKDHGAVVICGIGWASSDNSLCDKCYHTDGNITGSGEDGEDDFANSSQNSVFGNVANNDSPASPVSLDDTIDI